ncbi:hypothetical protein MSG28_016184 [Choristoneura fumiferana]|uniref:Uncharacterized protein n=1 Tax=Choristoneura fumiferana TaxID=7141 RepID=A0ACC0K6F0_CHOFU|nr:hypothetical protein MSG28_016184 [Choristoneura fumiferana]
MSECVKEEVAWEPDYVEALALWALYGDHVVKPDLNEAAPDLDDVSPTHFNLENAVSNMPKTETSQNSEDINITNLDNTTVSTKATQEPGFISTTHKSTPDVIASNIPKKGMMQNLKDISIRPYYTSVSYTSKQGATQNLVLVSTSHKSIPDIADSNIPKKEARQNFRDISTSLEDASGSKTSEEEATQHPEGISTSLEDASIRNSPENYATQEPGFVFTTHASFPDVSANNMTETEAMPNSWDISASLEDASVSNTPKAVEEPEPGDIFNTQANPQESGARNEPSLHKNAQPSLKPCYVNLERIAYKKAFICQICQKICRYKQNLRIHFLCHTNEELKSIKIEKKNTKKVKDKYNCHICGKALAWKQSLVKHMKKHTEDPFREQVRLKTPKDSVTKTYYTCDICGMSILWKNSLIMHVKKHAEDHFREQMRLKTPEDIVTKTYYTCDICGMSLLRKHSLIKHVKKHAKEVPFVCEVCKKQFRVPWELMDHIKLASCEPLKEALMVDPPTNKILQDLVLKSCYISLERIKTENEDPNAKITITDVDICSGSEDVVDVDQQLQGSSRAQECVGDTLEELWVSYNMIEKLKGINVLRNLKVLYMSNNLELPHLEDLLFVGNPLYDACELEAWRAEAARRLPNLKKLDGETVLREDEPPLTVASMQWRLSAGFCVKVRRQWRQQYGRSPVCRRVCMRS